MKNKIIIVGGGASGLMASIVAARNGAEVTILEKNDRVGKKLLATGNGRCNYTNEDVRLVHFHGTDKAFIEKALSIFGRDSVIEFFEHLGIAPASEDNGKIYPLSFQASSVLDVLRYEADRLGVEVRVNCSVSKIARDGKFKVYLKSGESLAADRVILATGGMAMPVSGSDGNGYPIAKSLGHKVIPATPSLVQLKLKSDKLKQINGTKVVGKASLFIDGELIKEDHGDILFTDYGISGPPILQLSREAVIALEGSRRVRLDVSIILNRSEEELLGYLEKRRGWMPEKKLEDFLIGMVNKRLIIPVIKELKLDKDKLAKDISVDELRSIAHILTCWSFEVIGHNGWGQAQTTAGGVLTKDIDPATMESRLVKGLYFAGELLDVDGDCGGYNLQWAWTSGYIAGNSASVKF
ncbi:NAD(P)/FAD-dependent oxidoreductase [Gudongella oleilytica]|uniref:NAD(P)/FAD-dependent oxidoreductase n=1 Tax=Gudongella oleilytica TaxID=1582259 RepID=UPI000FF8AD33|nr:NAD(P)/FAD-dependent oxidoreductase [Gudongella oleilytica]